MSAFNIREFTNPTGSKSWRVYGQRKGKQYRANFQDERLALSHKQVLELEAANMAPPPLVTTRLTPDQVKEAEACYHRIEGKGYTLSVAVEFALAHYNPSKKRATVQEAFAQYIASKKSAGLRPLTITDIERRLDKFVETFGAVQVSEVQAAELRPLIFREGTSTVNHSNYYRAFTGFFNWCNDQKFCVSSPMQEIESIKIDRAEPVALSLAECRAMLTHAQTFRDGELVPYIALALFCGIRPTELERLRWDLIDTEAHTITIPIVIAKKRARRIVDIAPNAREFIYPHALKQTPICGVNFRKRLAALKALAGFGSDEGLKPWTPDVLRHTAISMHLEKHDHEGKTAKWAGNSPDVIQTHYRALVKAKDAAEFWQITPGVQPIANLQTERKAA